METTKIVKGNLVAATSQIYNNGKLFVGQVMSVRGEYITLETRNGKSCKSFYLTDLNIIRVSEGYANL